jgi:hypothetical protein
MVTTLRSTNPFPIVEAVDIFEKQRREDDDQEEEHAATR